MVIRIAIFLVIYLTLITLLIYYEHTDHHASIDNYFDAIWFSIVTITTVGFGDYYPVTIPGRLIGYVFIISSISIYGIFIGQISSLMATIRENKKLGYKGTNLTGHAVIVGWDSYGRAVADQLVGVGKRIAVITNNKNDVDLIMEHYSAKQVFILYTDYHNLEFLNKANIKQSSVVFINLKDDTEKLVYILNLTGSKK